jgi:transcriptional regulator with XRE-family HTH domain
MVGKTTQQNIQGDGFGFHCEIQSNFSKVFRKWRKASKIPLKKIAFDLGLSIATISSWETGRKFPTGFNIERLINYMGVQPCRLFCPASEACVPRTCILTRHENLVVVSRIVGWQS